MPKQDLFKRRKPGRKRKPKPKQRIHREGVRIEYAGRAVVKAYVDAEAAEKLHLEARNHRKTPSAWLADLIHYRYGLPPRGRKPYERVNDIETQSQEGIGGASADCIGSCGEDCIGPDEKETGGGR